HVLKPRPVPADLYAQPAAADADPRCAHAAHAGAARSRVASARRRRRLRDARHRRDSWSRAAAHAVHTPAPHARATVDAPGAPWRVDGAGPLRRAGSRRFVPPGRVRDAGVCDGTWEVGRVWWVWWVR